MRLLLVPSKDVVKSNPATFSVEVDEQDHAPTSGVLHPDLP
ncbi:hypothetical protein [Hymenobacter tibetensis]|nr:hypothetical protein [Hymenobacter tibetensis]